MRGGTATATLPNQDGMTRMDIETLYPLVTEAIRRAEVLDDLHAPGARDAYRDVARLEERIADLLPPTGTQGAVARRGAVSAAISGAEFQRAIDLADRFIKESGAGTPLSNSLRALRAQAVELQPAAEAEMGTRYPVAVSRIGLGVMQNFMHAYRQQGAPLPIR